MSQGVTFGILGGVVFCGLLYVYLSSKRKGRSLADVATRSVYVLGVALAIAEVVLLGPMLFDEGSKKDSGLIVIFLPIMTLVATVVLAMLVGMVLQIFEGAVRPNKSDEDMRKRK